MITDQNRVLPGALLVLGIHLPMDGSFAPGGYAFPRAARSEGANDVSVGSAQDPWPHFGVSGTKTNRRLSTTPPNIADKDQAHLTWVVDGQRRFTVSWTSMPMRDE
jgi:hypothetical protein